MREPGVDGANFIASGDLVEVFSTRNPSEAQFVKMQLEAEGIAAVVLDDLILAGGSQLPHARVCVHQPNQALADAIIREWTTKPD